MAEDHDEEKEASAPKASMLPAIIVAVVCPLLTFVVMNYLVVPKFVRTVTESLGGQLPAKPEVKEEKKKDDGHGKKEEKKGPDAVKVSESAEGTAVEFPRVTVNLKGTMGTRYLRVSFSVVSDNKELGKKVEENLLKLKDLAQTVLGQKTVAEIETDANKNVLRSELLAQFNTVLGEGCVKAVYVTEFAMQ
jgi:flagellar FliL protein